VPIVPIVSIVSIVPIVPIVSIVAIVPIVAGACAARDAADDGRSVAVENPSPEGPRRSGVDDAGLGVVVDEYVESYFETFPTRATAAGRHDLDSRLEDLSVERLAAWLERNRATAARLRSLLDREDLGLDDRLDAELLLRQAELEVFDHGTLEQPATDPLFWTGIAGQAAVYLLVRDDRPLPERLAAAAARAEQVPRLVEQATSALRRGGSDRLAPELLAIAARQARSSADFYRASIPGAAGEGSTGAVDAELRARLERAGATAADALLSLAGSLDQLAASATGSPRLGDRYAERFRLVVGGDEAPDAVLARAGAALVAKRSEVAELARRIWSAHMSGAPPASDADVARALFRRVGDDHASTIEEFVADYATLVERAMAFAVEHEVATPIGELTLHTDRSPSYFVGQAVGGVYAAGPYAPGADTLFYLPTPPDDLGAEQREAFFRDFNHHFNVMIVPHEIVPGHYLQLKGAAHQPRLVRSLFGDGPFTEGWGTFCERLMLDLGWGDDLARVAHLKKQMENIARAIVDIRVHTGGMTRDEVLRFVEEEALQERQFAANMWQRSITSAPQLTFYWIGYDGVSELYGDARAAAGDAFVLRDFVDGVLSRGSLSVDGHRAVQAAGLARARAR
jgi:uncharacterized protein (DUF885 family)